MQQITSTGNSDREGNTIFFFIFEEVNETVLDFLRGALHVLGYIQLGGLCLVNALEHY